MRAAGVALVATGLALALAGCTGADQRPSSTGGTSTPNPTQASGSATASATPASPPGPSASLPSGGTSAAPAVLAPSTHLLDWASVEAATNDAVTRAGDFTLTVDQQQREVTIEGPGTPTRLPAPKGFRIGDVVSDGTHAVVVAQDSREVKPSRATVIELASGERTVLDGTSDVPTINGGAWAIGGGSVYHATYDAAGKYCLAAVDLASMTSQVTYCAPPRGGFSDVVVTPTATTLLTFSGQPQCRTPARLEGGTAVAIEGVTKCKGWDGAATANGAVWSVVTKETRVEVGEFYARADGGYYDLGVGSTGTLTWCGAAAYFVQDAQRDAGKARLLRWSPDSGLEVVYETPGVGAAFLAPPRCAGDILTVAAFGEGGDEQVWAKVA